MTCGYELSLREGFARSHNIMTLTVFGTCKVKCRSCIVKPRIGLCALNDRHLVSVIVVYFIHAFNFYICCENENENENETNVPCIIFMKSVDVASFSTCYPHLV